MLTFLTRAFAIEIKVSTTQELRQAIHTTNQTVDEEPIEILLADGHYNNATNLRITRPGSPYVHYLARPRKSSSLVMVCAN